MTSETVFIDSDILLDLFLDRVPFSIHTEKLFDTDFRTRFHLCTSALITANLNYVIAKQRDKDYAAKCIGVLLKYIRVLDLTAAAIEAALQDQFRDFEDSVQHQIAKNNNCSVILTRNLKDYKNSQVPVMTLESYLKKNNIHAN